VHSLFKPEPHRRSGHTDNFLRMVHSITRVSAAALSCSLPVSGLFLKKQDPIGGKLWDVTRVGVDLPKVIEEYKTTLQSGELKADGFTPSGCFPDKNLEDRDLHGKSTAYEGPISVIKYELVVPKTEQKPMTSTVCYEFCRRFDGVKFFGLKNGSKCYCEPMYVVTTAGNTGGCKVPCEGNPGEMCGGPDNSSIFEMHDCPPKEKFGSDAILAFTDLKTGVKEMGDKAKKCIDTLVKSGSALVSTQKAKGNTVTMKHQKEMTGAYQSILADINALSFDSAKVSATLETALGEYSGLPGDAKASDVEAKMTAVELASDAAAAALPQITEMYEQCHPKVNGTAADFDFYTPISETATAQTCDGKFISPAVELGSQEECAKLCTETVAPTQCVGFQFYTGLVDGAASVCMMFSEISGVTLYGKEGCPTTAPLEGKCFVPKVDIAAHELAVKDETVALDYCFNE